MNQAARPPVRQWVGRANAATIGAAAAEQIDFTRLPLLPTAPTTARHIVTHINASHDARKHSYSQSRNLARIHPRISLTLVFFILLRKLLRLCTQLHRNLRLPRLHRRLRRLHVGLARLRALPGVNKHLRELL